MAAMRARRPGVQGAAARGRKPGGPPPPMPRLAAIKMQGGRRLQETLRRAGSPRALGLALAGLIVTAGAAIAGAAWIGGSLVDAREAFAGLADGAAAGAGFAAAVVKVEGAAGARAEEVRAAVLPEGRRSLFAAEPVAVRARVKALDWVEEARVERLWPATVRVAVRKREAYARWEQDGVVRVVDADGDLVPGARPQDHEGLPLLVGAGAPALSAPVLAVLEEAPFRGRYAALVRVGGRRWTVRMRSGTEIALPAGAPEAALMRLAALHERYALLDRPLARIDLRTPGRMAVLPRAVLAGGPGLADTDRLLLSGGA